jgi:hypothetical protein
MGHCRLGLELSYSEFRSLRPATKAEIVPQAKPRTLSQGLIVPSICGRDVSGGKRPYIGCFKHLFQLLDFVDYAFYIHA